MSRVVASPNASKGTASGRLTPGVARSLGSDGSDGDRNTTPGVSPFRCEQGHPAPPPADATPGVAPSGRLIPLLLLALPLLAAVDAPPPPAGLAECRRVERYAGDVAEAARALGDTAAVITNSGQLCCLQRLRDRLGDLDRSILDLERALDGLEGALASSGEQQRGGR
jgi:hypothetical protein